MRILRSAALLFIAAPAAWSQTRTPATAAPHTGTFAFSREDSDRPMLGVITSSGNARDTLGLLITGVTRGSAAEKVGLEEGNRLVSIDGVNLKVAREDAGDPDMATAMSNRLRREIAKHKAGDDVTLEVYADGKLKRITAKLGTSGDIEKVSRSDDDEHGVLGVSLSASGSKRDTAGIFISAIANGSPADKAGIVEGDRIASINGVDLRVPRADAGEVEVAGARIERLQRALRTVKAGQAVDLVIVSGGKSRMAKVTTAKASELKEWGGANIRIGDGMSWAPEMGRAFIMPHPPVPPQPPDAPCPPRVRLFRGGGDGMTFNFEDIGPEVRRSIEGAMPEAMEGLRGQMDALRHDLPTLRARVIRKVVI